MADGSWWIPLASGALGIAGALGGTWLTQRGSQDREERQWRRQRTDKIREVQAQLYLDLMEFLENLGNRLIAEWNEDWPVEPIPDVQLESRLSARVGLYGSDKLRHGWNSVLSTAHGVAEEWTETNGSGSVHPTTLESALGAIRATRELLRGLVHEVEP